MDFSTVVLVIITLITLLNIFFLKSYKERRKIVAAVDKIPGPKAYPIIGTTLDLLYTPTKELFEFMKKRSQQFKPIFRVWAGSHPEVHVMKAEYTEIIFNSVTHIEKGKIYKFLGPWLGQGLLTSTGQRWHSHRKLITPTFHFKILENFFEVFVEKSNKLVNLLKANSNGKSFNIYPFITSCTLDMICETAMGVEINAMEQSNSEYVKAVSKISEDTIIRATRPWLHINFIFNNFSEIGKDYRKCTSILHGFTNKVIKERKETFEKQSLKSQLTEEDLLMGKKNRMAFLDLLIEASDNGKKLNDADIREEVDTFMFEGHDTTTAAISWCLFLLGNHLDCQEKAYQELQDIFGDSDRNISLEDLNKMKYLERCLKEALRLYPSVPFISRRLAEDVEIGGYKIPKRVELVIHIHDIHRDPEQFPNPDTFDPDNFLPERCVKRHPFSYIPFSAGPRNCIGQKFAIMEEKTVLASVLRAYKFKSVESVSEIKTVSELILRPSVGLFMKFESRT